LPTPFTKAKAAALPPEAAAQLREFYLASATRNMRLLHERVVPIKGATREASVEIGRCCVNRDTDFCRRLLWLA
jgi:hypothetical protein